jgi:hypothetical protein
VHILERFVKNKLVRLGLTISSLAVASVAGVASLKVG